MLSIFLLVAALAAVCSALPSPFPPYDPPSTGFQLVLNSGNASLDGHTLGACHEGAAIEGLCFSKSRFDDIGPSRYPFYHNVSNSQNPAANAFDTPGTMIWILQTTEWAVPSAMHFFGQSDTNQQNMIFTPSVESTSYVSFDKAGRMYRQKDSNGDWIAPDTRNSSETSTRYESWYICLTHYNYAITSLVWVDGDAPIPQDSTCQSVGVQRLWV